VLNACTGQPTTGTNSHLNPACSQNPRKRRRVVIMSLEWEAKKEGRPNFGDDAMPVEGGARRGCLANGCGAMRPYNMYIHDVR